ncbi:MAG: tetratricopeptide repeat protein [Burkholderiaceae bacterium]
MNRLVLDTCVLQSPELLGKHVSSAIASLQRGDRASAEEMYRSVLAAHPRHAATWVNLAALAVGLGEADAARAHAGRVLSLDARNVDAMINFGVASWHANQRRDAERAFLQALLLSPGLETPALNLSLMWQSIPRYDLAIRVLDEALGDTPGSFRLHEARAEIARLSGDPDSARAHALSALCALAPTLAPRPGGTQRPIDVEMLESERERMRATMAATCDRLSSAGIEHHLIGGVVLGITREGEPFHGDKDVDLSLPANADRDLIARLFEEGFTFMAGAAASDARRWCMGYTDNATGIAVDLFFAEPTPGGGLRQSMGWPDYLFYDYPPYDIGTLSWRGRDWPVPMPMPGYLASNFGEDWQAPRRRVGERDFDKRWFDTQVSCPGLVEESVFRAVNLVLLRLLTALRQGGWEKALALCDQMLVHGPISELEVVRDRLLAAGIR